MQIKAFLVASLTALVLAGCQTTGTSSGGAPATLSQRSSSDQRIGDENHPKILAQFGGAYQNPRVTGYVNQIGRDLAAVSEQPQAKWTFTVLDTPTINAFALPGGYVYVTRGLMALADDEAELAGVIGHEIGHVTAGHSSLRQDRGQVAGLGLLLGAVGLSVLGVDPLASRGLLQLGQAAAGGVLASYSRSDELDADNLGIRYLARAGYDPVAQAEFLESMGSAAALESRIAGRSYNPNSVDFFASHPANAPRTRQAIRVARNQGLVVREGAARNQDRFFSMIDGMSYGDSASQGFVDGRTFSHPELRFTYTVPRGFTITNSSQQVGARGPQGSLFIMEGGQDTGGDLVRFIGERWVPSLSEQARVGRFRELDATRINGLEAAYGIIPIQTRGRTSDALLVAIRMDGTIYRLTGIAPQGSGLIAPMEQAARTFRRLSRGEANGLRGQKIDIVTVRRGETVSSLAGRMNVSDFKEERFRVLNDLRPGEQLRAGQKVKLIR
ncbi:MAG: M48 family metalloprotease [Pseudomonadota bacterium]